MFFRYVLNIYDLRPFFTDFDEFLRAVDVWPVTWRVQIDDETVLLEESEILDIAKTLLMGEDFAQLEYAISRHLAGV